MLNCLIARAEGILQPDVFVKAHLSKRLLSLKLSETFTVDPGSSRSISNCLDVDNTELRYLLTAQSDGSIRIYDTQPAVNTTTGCSTLPCIGQKLRGTSDAHSYSVNTVQWYPIDTGMFISSGNDNLLKIWDTNTLTVVEEHKLDGAIYHHDMSLVATKNNLVLAAPQSGKIAVIDLVSGSKAHTLIGHEGPVFAVKWSTSCEYELATGGADGRINIWDIRASKGAKYCLDQYRERPGDEATTAEGAAHNGQILGIEYSPDGRSIVSYGRDDRLKVWSASTGTYRNVNFGHLANDLALHVKFVVATNVYPEMVFLPCDSNILILNLNSGDVLERLQGHFNQVHCVCRHPDRAVVYSSSSDHNILVWETGRHPWKEEEDEKHEKEMAISAACSYGGADDWSSESEDDNG